jgi:hypothetical protein
MDGRSDEAIVGGGADEGGDVVHSKSASTIRQTSVPLIKKCYKKLGIIKFVLHYLI